MTEHQIKGCQALAEVEGLKQGNAWQVATESAHYTKIEQLNYLHDWNDLLRVAQVIERHGFIVEITLCLAYTCRIFKPGKHFLYESNDSKLSVFMCLVEAAEWIKQQDK